MNTRLAIHIDRLDTVMGVRYDIHDLASSWGATVNEDANAILLPRGWTLKAYSGSPTSKLVIDQRGLSRAMLRDHQFLDRFTRRGRLYPLTRYRIREIEEGKYVMYDNVQRNILFTFAKGIGARERVAWARLRVPNFESPFEGWDEPTPVSLTP